MAYEPDSTYVSTWNRIDNSKIAKKCERIKKNAEDLLDAAKKIETVCDDLNDPNVLSINDTTFGENIREIATVLRADYDSVCARCDEIVEAANARREKENESAARWYEWKEAEDAKKSQQTSTVA